MYNKRTLSTAIGKIKVSGWMAKKLAIVQEHIGDIAKETNSDEPPNVDSTTTLNQRVYNIDNGLLEN